MNKVNDDQLAIIISHKMARVPLPHSHRQWSQESLDRRLSDSGHRGRLDATARDCRVQFVLLSLFIAQVRPQNGTFEAQGEGD
jgi:hypothetical protein